MSPEELPVDSPLDLLFPISIATELLEFTFEWIPIDFAGLFLTSLLFFELLANCGFASRQTQIPLQNACDTGMGLNSYKMGH